MKWIWMILVLLLSNFYSYAQKADDFRAVDRIMLSIPDSSTESPGQIAGYIKENYTQEADIIRAVFIWVAASISYDIENMYSVNFYESTDEVVRQTLETRKGVCMGYAYLFEAIASGAGIRNYVVSGYTRQNGYVDYLPHAWCAAEIDSAWYLFDPTWGAGHVLDEQFVAEINNQYFMARPEDLIRSHMPFDPLWQFLNYPVSFQDFNKGDFSLKKEKKYFNYLDSLIVYDKQDELDRLIASNNRINKNGTRNSLVYDRVVHNQQTIEYLINKDQVDKYNEAVNEYNEGIARLNRFINYRNNQFTPKMPDNEILDMVASAERSLKTAKTRLSQIEKPGRDIAMAILQLSNAIDEAMVNLNEQQAFLDKYFSSGKAARKSMFYRYTWMGIPIK